MYGAGKAMACGLLVDDSGMCWSEFHPNLAKMLGTHRTGEALSSYVIRNLGFIRLVPRGRTVSVQLNPATVHGKAITGACYWLTDSLVDRAIVEPVGELAPSQILASRQDLIGYLGGLLDARAQRPDFILSPMQLAQSQFSGRLNVALDIVRADLPVALKTDLLHRMFDGQIVLSEFDTIGGQYKMLAVGDGLLRLDPQIKQRFLGKSFGEALGGAYGAWITETLATVARAGTPTTQYVEAVVPFGRIRPRRMFYERMLVPATVGSGTRYLLTVTSAA